MKKCLAAIAIALLPIAATGCSDDPGPTEGRPSKPETVAIEGSLLLKAFPGSDAAYAEREALGARCEGRGGYGDIRGGAAVIIHNAEGDQVGLGALDPGASTTDTLLPHCRFTFEVEGVPDGDGLLTLTIGNRPKYSFDRSEAGNLEITLG